jgi:hypothetical protein
MWLEKTRLPIMATWTNDHDFALRSQNNLPRLLCANNVGPDPGIRITSKDANPNHAVKHRVSTLVASSFISLCAWLVMMPGRNGK